MSAAASGGTIPVTVNGDAREVPAGATLLELLGLLGQDPRTVAVECNGEVVPRVRHQEVELLAGDRIEVVRFVQGGREWPPAPRGCR